MARDADVSDKAALRDAARAKRVSLTPHDIDTLSRRICTRFLSIIPRSDPLMVYVSKPLEVHTHDLIADLIRQKRKIVVPIIEKETRSLRLSYLMDMSHLVESTFHVPEPVGNENPARPEDIMAVIVPVLAFDRRGHRLGYGAGYYDRFLARYPHLNKIGFAFSCQEIPQVPHDETDIRMDLIITEDSVIDCTPE